MEKPNSFILETGYIIVHYEELTYVEHVCTLVQKMLQGKEKINQFTVLRGETHLQLKISTRLCTWIGH